MEYAEVYLALTGVEGDARADEHKGEIELFDWAWGMEMADRSPTGKDEDRQAEGKMLEISKAVDKASVPMMNLLKNGTTSARATLTIRQRMQKAVELKLALTGVRVMSCKLNVKTDDMEVVLDEDWTLTYEKIEVLYKSDHGNKGQKAFSLVTPPGVEQSEPARLSSPDTGSGEDEPCFSKQDIIDIIEEYLKKHPQKK